MSKTRQSPARTLAAHAVLITYTLIALLSLGLITTIAAFQSGRLLAPLRTLEETAREITTTSARPSRSRTAASFYWTIW